MSWLGDIFGSRKQPLFIDGFKIPEAYTPIILSSKEIKENRPENLRRFNLNYFIFDPDNSEYQVFLAECRRDTKELKVALELEFINRTFRFTTKNIKKDFIRMSFLIRPIYFNSFEVKTNENRWQDRGVEFMLHFDELHSLQDIRFHLGEFNSYKHFLVEALMEKGDFLKDAYGNWPLFAKIIADCIEQLGDPRYFRKN